MTADHERAREMRSRKWPIDRAIIDAEFPQPWVGYGLLARIVFFLLTCAGIAAFIGLTDAELVAAAICLVLAEFLIRARKWFHTGVEEALWIGGLFAALQALPNSSAPEANLLLAATAGVAGFRVRNPLFGALAAFFVTQYLEARGDLGTLAALLIGLATLFALYRTWNRPSTEWLFVALAVTMPAAGAIHADSRWAPVTIALYLGYAAISFVSAIVKRHHWMFAAAAVSLAVAVGVAHFRFAFRAELTLGIAGAALLLASWLTARALRDRTRGFVMTPAAVTEFDDDLQSIGSFAAATPSAGNPPESRPQDGGGFGGAGATGDL